MSCVFIALTPALFPLSKYHYDERNSLIYQAIKEGFISTKDIETLFLSFVFMSSWRTANILFYLPHHFYSFRFLLSKYYALTRWLHSCFAQNLFILELSNTQDIHYKKEVNVTEQTCQFGMSLLTKIP